MSLNFRITASVVALVVVAAVVSVVIIDRESDSRAMLLPDKVMKVFQEPKPLTTFSLTDQNDQVFDLASLKGKWSFVFFGYTHCPDVCPMTLAKLAKVHAYITKNMANAKDIQFVFVSVDPNRDSSARLAEYVHYFDSTFLGVTGDDAQIANLAGQLSATYKVKVKAGVDNYPVFHTPGVFLLDPRARYYAVFTPPHDPEAIGKRFQLLWKIEGGHPA